MAFQNGNKAAVGRADSWRDFLARSIRTRLEQQGDALTNEQFIALVSKLATLKGKKAFRGKSSKKVTQKSPEYELHDLVREIEANQHGAK